MIRFSCPVCTQHYSADPDAAGRKMACASCGRRVQIPNPPDARPLEPASQAACQPAPDRAPVYVGAAVIAVVALKLLTVLAIILILCIRLSLIIR